MSFFSTDDDERVEELKETAKDNPATVDIDEVVSLLNSSNSEVRSSATFILHLEARDHSERVNPVIDELIKSLNDSDWSTRRQSARALSTLSDSHPSTVKRAKSDLLQLFSEFGEREETFNYSERALSSIVREHPGLAEEYLDHLIDVLDHPKDEVRRDAANGIQTLVPTSTNFGMPNVVGEKVASHFDEVVSYLNDDNRFVRERIIEALYRWGCLGKEPELLAPYVPQIASRLDDSYSDIHQDAAKTLEYLASENPDWVEPLNHQLLNRLGREIDADVIRPICNVLGEVGYYEAREKLEFIAENDPNEKISKSGSEALGNIPISSSSDTQLYDPNSDPDSLSKWTNYKIPFRLRIF